MTSPCGSYGVLTRDQAAEIVSCHTFMHEQYKAVSFYSCHQLLGDRFDLLLKDQVRNKGPTAESIYPWNVIDYMVPNYPRPIARGMSEQPESQPCKWWNCEDDYELWEAECGFEMFLTECGTPTSMQLKFCPSCGRPLAEETSSDNQSHDTPARGANE